MRALIFAVAALISLAVGCGGDDITFPGASATDTPAASATSTPAPTATPTASD